MGNFTHYDFLKGRTIELPKILHQNIDNFMSYGPLKNFGGKMGGINNTHF